MPNVQHINLICRSIQNAVAVTQYRHNLILWLK